MIREPIAVALFAKLQAVSNFVTASRVVKTWSDVAPADQPALFLAQGKQRATQRPGLGPVWDVSYEALVYVNTGADPTVSPSTVLNPIVDAIEAAFAPDNAMTNKCSLGGLVQHCWIEGEIETDEGVLGGQGVAIIPIVVKVA